MHMYKQSKAKGSIRQGYLRMRNTFVFTAIRIRVGGGRRICTANTPFKTCGPADPILN
jgi:hypothetical protein